eukprot:1562325-Amphidinium_carterae.1
MPNSDVQSFISLQEDRILFVRRILRSKVRDASEAADGFELCAWPSPCFLFAGDVELRLHRDKGAWQGKPGQSKREVLNN